MSSILIVEDDPSRIVLFRRGIFGVPVTNLDRASGAIAWLHSHTPSVIFLDYDLHENGTPRSISGCGGDVVSAIVKEKKRFHRTFIIIHSLNKDKAPKLREKLHQSGIAAACMPFIWERPRDLERIIMELR